jgi:hypothetical protein
MSFRFISALIPALACLALLPSRTVGREIEDWPYEKLFKHSTLVVVVKPLSVREATAKDGTVPSDRRDTQTGIVTSFKVLVVVKGEYKQTDLDLFHFRRKKSHKLVFNGPNLVSFFKKALDPEDSLRTEKDHMLFLKKNKAGRLEFVSGQIDPILSVK